MRNAVLMRNIVLLLLVAGALAAAPGTTAAAELQPAGAELVRLNAAAARDAAVDAGVPAADADLIISRAAQRKFDAQTIERLLAAAESAAKKGLPVRPVVDRIEQGLAKNVPAERIAAAAERLAENLGRARSLVGSVISGGIPVKDAADRAEAIEAVARAIEAAVAGSDVEHIGKAVQARKGSLALFSRAVDSAAHLAVNGVSPSRATDHVRAALGGGSSERDLAAREKRFSESLTHGEKPDDAVAAFDRDRAMDRMYKRSDQGRDSRTGMGGRRR